MSSDAQPPAPVAPKPPTPEEFDLLHETAAHPFHAELWRRAMGPDYPADADPSSSCSRSLLAHIHEALALRSDDTLVDLGCGRGGPGLWLARESGARLIGIDFSPRAVSLANTLAARFTLRVPAEFHVGSFERTELPDASVQGLMSVDALPFAPDRDAALREVRRILEPGARAVFTTTKPGEGQPSGTSSPRTWEERIDGAGLHLEHEASRSDVAPFWERLYSLWREHETSLRAAFGDAATDCMLAEARELGPSIATRHFVVFTVRRSAR
jgi:SAM-dependent methyltransferase